MITLYHFDASVCSEKVRMVLFEKNLDWENREVDLFKGEQFDPAYMKLNPKAVVPTLIHDGRVLNDSTLICEYIDEVWPAPALSPADPYERLQMRAYAKACDEGLHQGIACISYASMFRERLRKQNKTHEEMLKHYARIVDLERRDRQMAVYEQAQDAPHVYRAVAAYEKTFAKIEKVLGDGRMWLCGGMFSLAEINLVTYFARLEWMNLLDVWIHDRPLTTAWYARIKARPCFVSEIAGRMRTDEWDEMRRVGSGPWRGYVADKLAHYRANDFGAAFY